MLKYKRLLQGRLKVDTALMEQGVSVALLQEVSVDCVSLRTQNFKWLVFKTPNNKQRGLAVLITKDSGIIVKELERIDNNIIRLNIAFEVAGKRVCCNFFNVHAPNRHISRFLASP